MEKGREGDKDQSNWLLKLALVLPMRMSTFDLL